MTTRVFTLAQNVISPFSLSSVSRKSCIRRSRRLTAENTLPAPRTLAPQDLEPRLRPESGILCFNRSISGGFDRLRHVKTLLPFVRTFLKGPPTGLIRFSSSACAAISVSASRSIVSARQSAVCQNRLSFIIRVNRGLKDINMTAHTEQYVDRMVEDRRSFHMNPEQGWLEFETTAFR